MRNPHGGERRVDLEDHHRGRGTIREKLDVDGNRASPEPTLIKRYAAAYRCLRSRDQKSESHARGIRDQTTRVRICFEGERKGMLRVSGRSVVNSD